MMMLFDILHQANEVDTDVFLSFNKLHNLFADYFMSVYSGKIVWIPMYVSIVYVMVRNFFWKEMLFCLIGIALTITLSDQTCATFIRPFVERFRPANLNSPISSMVHIVDGHRGGGSYGFPSCHATNVCALAFYFWLVFRKRWLTVFLMGWALLTCYSRIYLGVHYPGDLLVGGAIGAIYAYLVFSLFRKITNYKPQKRMVHYQAPIIVGGLTIVGILIYSTVMYFSVP